MTIEDIGPPYTDGLRITIIIRDTWAQDYISRNGEWVPDSGAYLTGLTD